MKYEDEHGREPSIGELADLSGYNTKKVTKILDGTMIVNDSSTLSEDSRQSSFTTKDVGEEDYWEYVYSSVGPIDQKIMEWTSGYHGKPVLSNNVIATKLGITPAAVSQRKNKILTMMSEVRGLL
jgi:DNA-directed RNA polymerase specialized sigma subunit